MELIRGQHNLRPQHRGCVATIGNFDGVHLGHQLILDQLSEQATRFNLPRLVITFEPQPQEFFTGPNAPPARLMRLREKLQVLEELGIERVLCLEFDQRLASLPASTFIDTLLVERLGIRHLVIGDDFRFGHRRSGDFALLAEAGQRYGFSVASSHSHILDGERVSSTRIRQALAQGELEQAARLLGRPYHLCGRVAHGDQRGRTIGFPTANLHLHRRVTPVSGVYAVLLSDPALPPWPGIANVGRRPTVAGEQERLEVHLLDFQGDLYGRHVKVSFLHYLRPEQRFASLTALQEQIRQDEQTARRYFTECSLSIPTLPIPSPHEVWETKPSFAAPFSQKTGTPSLLLPKGEESSRTGF